ncbi:MAG: hypothetical protein WCV85_06750 [Patescibacteria group bacterium]
MRVYYFQAPSPKPRMEHVRADLLQLMDTKHVFYITNDGRNSLDVPQDELEALAKTGGSMLDNMDALVIEGSTPDADVGYLLAYAMSLKKPTLYLYDKDIANKGVLKYLGSRQIPAHIKVQSYSGSSVVGITEKYLTELLSSEAAGQPTIKFTFRITPQIEQYLQQKAKKTGMSKADFLRKKIEEDIIGKEKK